MTEPVPREKDQIQGPETTEGDVNNSGMKEKLAHASLIMSLNNKMSTTGANPTLEARSVSPINSQYASSEKTNNQENHPVPLALAQLSRRLDVLECTVADFAKTIDSKIETISSNVNQLKAGSGSRLTNVGKRVLDNGKSMTRLSNLVTEQGRFMLRLENKLLDKFGKLASHASNQERQGHILSDEVTKLNSEIISLTERTRQQQIKIDDLIGDWHRESARFGDLVLGARNQMLNCSTVLENAAKEVKLADGDEQVSSTELLQSLSEVLQKLTEKLAAHDSTKKRKKKHQKAEALMLKQNQIHAITENLQQALLRSDSFSPDDPVATMVYDELKRIEYIITENPQVEQTRNNNYDQDTNPNNNCTPSSSSNELDQRTDSGSEGGGYSSTTIDEDVLKEVVQETETESMRQLDKAVKEDQIAREAEEQELQNMRDELLANANEEHATVVELQLNDNEQNYDTNHPVEMVAPLEDAFLDAEDLTSEERKLFNCSKELPRVLEDGICKPSCEHLVCWEKILLEIMVSYMAPWRILAAKIWVTTDGNVDEYDFNSRHTNEVDLVRLLDEVYNSVCKYSMEAQVNSRRRSQWKQLASRLKLSYVNLDHKRGPSAFLSRVQLLDSFVVAFGWLNRLPNSSHKFYSAWVKGSSRYLQGYLSTCNGVELTLPKFGPVNFPDELQNQFLSYLNNTAPSTETLSEAGDLENFANRYQVLWSVLAALVALNVDENKATNDSTKRLMQAFVTFHTEVKAALENQNTSLTRRGKNSILRQLKNADELPEGVIETPLEHFARCFDGHSVFFDYFEWEAVKDIALVCKAYVQLRDDEPSQKRARLK